jgi:hypothetical protein
MALRVFSSGLLIKTRLSMRPGRNRAASNKSARFVAPMTKIPVLFLNPSRATKSSFNVLSRSAEEDSLFFGEAEGRRSPHPSHHVDYKRRQQQQNDTTNETLRTISTFRLDLTMEKMMIMDDPVVQ